MSSASPCSATGCVASTDVRAFVVSVPADEAELAADRLWALGAPAIEERGDGDVVELWTTFGDDDAAVARAGTGLESGWRWRTEWHDEDAAELWREHAAPIDAGRSIRIVPEWLDDAGGAGERRCVRIEPGAAFGLGDHPTTRSTIAAAEPLLADADSVLDVGCGTGILSIVACVLGARRVRAVDVSTAAVESTIANAVRNDVRERVEVDATPVADLDGTFDVVLANVLAPALVAMADDLRRLTAPTGALVLSGVLADRHDHVLEALEPMEPRSTLALDGWAAVTLVHPASASTA